MVLVARALGNGYVHTSRFGNYKRLPVDIRACFDPTFSSPAALGAKVCRAHVLVPENIVFFHKPRSVKEKTPFPPALDFTASYWLGSDVSQLMRESIVIRIYAGFNQKTCFPLLDVYTPYWPTSCSLPVLFERGLYRFITKRHARVVFRSQKCAHWFLFE